MPPIDLSVTIISVCYNSAAVVGEMLRSIAGSCPVILVDNASDDVETLQRLAKEHGATLLRNEVNCGFGVACNQAAELSQTEFLFFLNPDATLMPTTLTELVQAARRYPQASAMNPRILDEQGLGVFKRHSHLMPRSQFLPRKLPLADRELNVLSGCAFFVRKSDFDAVQGFDPNIFLYHEDDDLSRRLRAQRGPLMFVRDAVISHVGGMSSPRSPEVAALKAWHMARSRVYATRKHRRPLPVTSAMLSACQQLLSLSVIASPRKRAKQWNFLLGVLSTFRDGGVARPSDRLPHQPRANAVADSLGSNAGC